MASLKPFDSPDCEVVKPSELMSMGELQNHSNTARCNNEVSQALVARVESTPPEGRGLSLLDPTRLIIPPGIKEGVSTTHDLWRHRNSNLPGMWFYLADNGDLRQFWAHVAEKLEGAYQAGKRQCTLAEPRWLGPKDSVGWYTVFHTVDFDKATMTNEVHATTRTILRLIQGSPVWSMRAPVLPSPAIGAELPLTGATKKGDDLGDDPSGSSTPEKGSNC